MSLADDITQDSFSTVNEKKKSSYILVDVAAF